MGQWNKQGRIKEWLDRNVLGSKFVVDVTQKKSLIVK